MADHWLDGGSASHLAADGFGDTADLAADPDLETVGIVVAAIALVAAVAVAHATAGPDADTGAAVQYAYPGRVGDYTQARGI
jgi:hypothetical protein